MKDTYIYLKVPAKWKYVYDLLLRKMAELSEDLLKDCNASCNGTNKEYISCWNMFQAACSAYEIGEKRKAEVLIQFITTKLGIKIPEISNVYVFHDDEERSNNYIQTHINEYDIETYPMFSEQDLNIGIHQLKHYHYILIPKDKLNFVFAKYGQPGFETTLDIDTDYEHKEITIDEIDYNMYYYYSPVGKFDELIKLTFEFTDNQ